MLRAMSDLIAELAWRGFIHQQTDEAELASHLSSGSRTLYGGFDPTGSSLTIGNLVAILLLAHFQRAGHRPIVLMGGGTGLIGDPSGKSAERQLLNQDIVASNVASIQRIFTSILSFEGPNAAKLVNNADWLTKLGYLEVLRDVGKHFTVNAMIQRDSVRERLNNREQGISYTEFSYMILQAYDFQYLAQHEDVSLQVGGSDQWGNIVAGVDLTRRVLRREVFGLTAPLLTKADGGKFGKTEKDAVWLTAERTSAYAFYQFWLNTADADVERFLKLFTFLSQSEIATLVADHLGDPSQRLAQRRLARETTALLHGASGLERAEKATAALFSGDVADLDEDLLTEVFAEAPSTQHELTALDGDGLALVELLPQTSLCKSKREAREFLDNGSISLNGAKASLETRLRRSDLLHNHVALVRRGRKAWHVARFLS
jgi:tyrosyl-tRNA synthetase